MLCSSLLDLVVKMYLKILEIQFRLVFVMNLKLGQKCIILVGANSALINENKNQRRLINTKMVRTPNEKILVTIHLRSSQFHMIL